MRAPRSTQLAPHEECLTCTNLEQLRNLTKSSVQILKTLEQEGLSWQNRRLEPRILECVEALHALADLLQAALDEHRASMS
ncbi:MAG TPA: hypothetical protein VGL72_12415 [Bryobacteraceae bacterium]|jgi:hypothetical protein